MHNTLKAALFCCFSFFTVSAFAGLPEIENTYFRLDNPWLCLKAIRETYPDIADSLCFDSELNDWCLSVRGVKLYWAHGRLLRREETDNWENWEPFISYLYKEKAAEPAYFTDTLIKALSGSGFTEFRQNAPPPNYTFLSLVYEGRTKKEILKHIRRFKFLGHEVWIHKRIAAPLSRVEQKIYKAGKTEKKVKRFINDLQACWGFKWRVIADSGKLSNHSWGAAVDLIPSSHSKAKTYWFWESVHNKKWMSVPLSARWNPPQEVIKIFESEGFIWGGKWELWDNIHFEYRPELLYIQDFIFSNNVFNAYTEFTAAKKNEFEAGRFLPEKSPDSALLSSIHEALHVLKIIDTFIERMHDNNDFTIAPACIEEDL